MHGKHAGPATGRFDAAIGDTAALERHAAGVPIKARISVFGPGEDPPMTELGLLALSGLLGIVGEPPPGSPARLAGHQAAYAAGLAACTGLLAALRAGGDEIVDVSLFDVCVWLNWKTVADMLTIGSVPVRGATATWFTVPRRTGMSRSSTRTRTGRHLCDLIGDRAAVGRAFRHRPVARRQPRGAVGDHRPVVRGADPRRDHGGGASAADTDRPGEMSRRIADGRAISRPAIFSRADGMPALPLVWDGRRLASETAGAA